MTALGQNGGRKLREGLEEEALFLAWLPHSRVPGLAMVRTPFRDPGGAGRGEGTGEMWDRAVCVSKKRREGCAHGKQQAGELGSQDQIPQGLLKAMDCTVHVEEKCQLSCDNQRDVGLQARGGERCSEQGRRQCLGLCPQVTDGVCPSLPEGWSGMARGDSGEGRDSGYSVFTGRQETKETQLSSSPRRVSLGHRSRVGKGLQDSGRPVLVQHLRTCRSCRWSGQQVPSGVASACSGIVPPQLKTRG